MNKQFFQNALILLMLMASASLFAQQTIKVDTKESFVRWMGKKPTREHTGFVKLSDGELQVDNNTIKGGSFTLDMNTITNVDLKDQGSNQKLVNHLKSADFFNVEQYPTAKFVITTVTNKNHSGSSEDDKKTTHRIEGDLTIKGITKKVSFDASINILNGKFAASTQPFTINRTDWDVNYQSKSIIAGLKDEFIFDDITIDLELVSR